MSNVSILLIGDTCRAEFLEAQRWLASRDLVVHLEDVDTAATRLDAGQLVADVMVMAQSYPGQFSAESIDRLWQSAPLARVVMMLGSWCEGETRSGNPWPASARVFWHQWIPQADREIDSLCRGICSTWSLPTTAIEDERFLVLAEGVCDSQQGTVALWSRSFDMEDWLDAACRRRGYATHRIHLDDRPTPSETTVALFDAVDGMGEDLDDLRRIATTIAPVPVIVLVGFPRVEDRDRLMQAGAAAVMSKPLLIEDLYWQIDRVTEQVINE